MRALLVLVAALTVVAADRRRNTTAISLVEDERSPHYQTNRHRRNLWPFSSDPTEFSCQIAPYVTFYPGDHSAQMPAYLCTNGQTEVLIATRSFHLGHSMYEYATYTTLRIDPSVLHIEYPGVFVETPQSYSFKHSSGKPRNPTVEITGLLLLTEGGIQRKTHMFKFMTPSLYTCQFVPYVTFHNTEIPDVPVYRCIRGPMELLIATDSFRNPYDFYEVSQIVELNIADNILEIGYPGTFTQVSSNVFRSNPQLTHKGGEFFVRGLLRLADY